ncbi:DUF3667 domain-containing protein [Brevundimonas sp. PAMC22021]|uniref:DUF3667 domain-containing protein n=1 Tax=Brevundimonas sp. PAMC22021 TaxID=2861285 RepID=UPI001C629C28|nr:DUF3667 domain-containing protein [Brevundimonas sp. PAMC22021]QYF86327.1 DUF3667 domain-containing protein [Brevundimonas sp. PAMC22021]
MDVDAAGGMVSAGLIAGAIERPAGHAGEAGHRCADCGAEVSSKFCPECGQPAHTHRTLLHLGEELLHGVMHFDARVWRTLPLLAFNPGRLTREWVEGRRTRYVSPLAMFLFTIFVMFFALTFAPHREAEEQPMTERIAEQRQDVQEAETALTQVRAEMAQQDGRIAQEALKGAEFLVAQERARLTGMEQEARDGRADGLKPGSWQAQIKDMAAENRIRGKGLGGVLVKKLQNPDLALYKLQQTIYKFAFLLVPLSIPFMALLFLWRRGFTLYDHGVFVLYSLTFMAMLLMALVLAGMIPGLAVPAAFLAMLAVPVHMFAQLKGAYGLSWWSAGWRTMFLLNFSTIVVSLFVAAIVYLGLGH